MDATHIGQLQMETTNHIVSRNNPTKKLPKPWGRRYTRKRIYCLHLGQEWAFTHQTWYQMWCESGVMHLAGRGESQYRMVRVDPYEAWGPHNCRIVRGHRLLYRNLALGWRRVR